MDFSPAQFESVSHIDKAAWKDEIALHSDLFNQLSYHLPPQLLETKALLEKRIAA